ncbi:uncharacterized protein I206_103649 [Kwoniella pini CBS 10737]|uniref:Uncharacterized protein n=1 Tax=Kwoniella pini CBS 10737 TaxID=1296096 RepID=A0A1B9I9B2_9TREE|nr:uncharacterized protein I206_01348 [Kwoniella pini CBS 10737]OCF52064.1 hypothetical protein I206_01348 [Kwoniella pini CBS 10737]
MPTAVRGANPAAILVVVFLVLAVFVFFGGGNKKSKTNSVRSRGKGKDDIDTESEVSEGEKRKRRKEKGKDESNSSEDEEARAKRKERERRKLEKKKKHDEKRKKKEEAKERNKDAQQNITDDQVEIPRVGVPNLPPISQPEILSDKKWERDSSKRPERPSGRSPPVLLKRGSSNEWIRPPLSGKKGVSFDDNGKIGKEANSYASFNIDDPSNLIYDQSHTSKLNDFESNQRGGFESGIENSKDLLDGSNSPLNYLEKTGKLNSKLIIMMKNIENACLIDHLDLIGKMPKNLLIETDKLINQESFIPGLGMIPSIIIEIIKLMLIEEIIDLPLIISSQSTSHLDLLNPNKPYDSQPEVLYQHPIEPIKKEKVELNFVENHLSKHGIPIEMIIKELNYPKWKSLNSNEITKIVSDWTLDKLKKAFSSTSNNITEEEEDKFITIKLILGYFLPYFRGYGHYRYRSFLKEEKVPGFEERIGKFQNELINWFKYIGKFLLISKMFNKNGSFLNSECNLKIQISKREKQIGFIIDYTFFIPKLSSSSSSSSSNPSEIEKLGFKFYESKKTIVKVKSLALQWVNHLNEFIYPQLNSSNSLEKKEKLFNDLYPFQIIRLTFRPNGILQNKMNLKIVKESINNSINYNKNEINEREILIMNLDSKKMKEIYENDNKKEEQGKSILEHFGSMYRSMTCHMIRFKNKRPFHWYNPNFKEEEIFNKFDEKTLEYLFIMIGPCLNKFENKIKYSTVQAIDFGGIIPILKNQNKFLNLNEFKGLKWILLPLLINNNNNQNTNFNSANLILNENFGLFENLLGFNSISITFHSLNFNDKNQFLFELNQILINNLKIELNELKNQIEFILINNDNSNENDYNEIEDDLNPTLNEFDIPIEMLPRELIE